METLINLAVVILVFILIFIIERVSKRKLPPSKEIQEYQEEIDKKDFEIKERYGLELTHDAKEEILKVRETVAALSFIFSGVIIALGYVVLIITNFFKFEIMNAIIFSAIYLILIGLIKISESKSALLKVLSMVVLVIILAISILNLISKYLYYYF